MIASNTNIDNPDYQHNIAKSTQIDNLENPETPSRTDKNSKTFASIKKIFNFKYYPVH